MRAVDIIMKKRGSLLNKGGEQLNREEIEFLINGYVNGSIPDYQVSSWLMAVFFNGMSFKETACLTDVMLHSGDTIDLTDLHGPFVDKHSTGGVGDKISLPLAPITAACGLTVPMMSGRALGHTGGTLDKLEAIDGYRVGLEVNEFKSILQKTGFAMTGQTEKIVPADRLLYALRDVTGTVESIPLITASILSKKAAEGSDALVFDVKFGNGAFMKTPEAAQELAESLVKTAQSMGKKSAALLTNMNTPLGMKIGNFLEIEETLDCLEGKGPEDVMELTYALGALMLVLGGKASTEEEGIERCKVAVQSGRAMELFLANVREQGGDDKALLSQRNVRRSPFKRTIEAAQDGFLSIHAYKTGLAGVNLGVGRNRTDEKVCPDAGIILHAREGCFVKKGQLIMEVFGKNEECFEQAVPLLEDALSYSSEKMDPVKLVLKKIL